MRSCERWLQSIGPFEVAREDTFDSWCVNLKDIFHDSKGIPLLKKRIFGCIQIRHNSKTAWPLEHDVGEQGGTCSLAETLSQSSR